MRWVLPRARPQGSFATPLEPDERRYLRIESVISRESPLPTTKPALVTVERVRRDGYVVWRAAVLRLQGRQTLLGGLGLVGLVVVCGAWIFHEGRDLSFYLDEWYFPLYRLSPFTANSLLAPHNGHIVVVPALIYKVMLRAFGMRDYTAYRSLVLIFHLAVGVLVYIYARRRLGPIAALAPAVVILLLGKGAENFLFAFQIDFLGPVVTGLACLLLIDHRSLAGRLAITGLLIVTVGFSEIGLAFLVAVAVALAVTRRWRDGWMVAIPAVLYLAWYARYGLGQSGLNFSNFIHAPQFMVEEIAGAAGGAVGLDQDWGRIIAVILAYLLVRQVLRGAASHIVLALVAGALFLWLVIALTRSVGGSPYASRYLYIGAVFIIVVGVELTDGRIQFGPVGLGLLGIATVAIVASNMVNFFSLRDFFNSQAAYTRADLGALEIARAHVPPNYVFSDPSHGLPYILSSSYFAAVARYGSAADTQSEIAAAPAAIRVATDQALQRLEPLDVKSSVKVATRACRSERGRDETPVSRSGVIVVPTEQPVQVSAARFATSGSVSLGSLRPGQRYLITAEPDGSTIPWRLATVSASGYDLCTRPA